MNDDIGKPPPNSQPYRNLGASPVVLHQVYLPPRDPHLGVIASHLNSNPWEASLTCGGTLAQVSKLGIYLSGILSKEHGSQISINAFALPWKTMST